MSDQFVYFIQADDEGPIKIGFTADDPKRRLNQLQTGNPAALKLLGSISAPITREKELHAELAEWRLQGEWFKPHPTVLSAIQNALSSTEHANCGGHHCSFCGACQKDRLCLIAGPGDLFICDDCVGICGKIVAEQLDKRAEFILSVPAFPEMSYGG